MQHINIEIPYGPTRCLPELRGAGSKVRLGPLRALVGWVKLVCALSLALLLAPVVAAVCAVSLALLLPPGVAAVRLLTRGRPSGYSFR